MERRSAEERLINVRTWLDTRRNQVTAILVGLEETAHELSEESVTGSMGWLKTELDEVELKLKEIEKVEMDSWLLTTRTRGRSERATRSEAWTKWHQQISGKITSLKRQVWKSSAQQAAAVAPSRISCHRTGGFLERVKLPTFTGHQEDYGEFKIQFLEMCRGEAYSAVIELAQLRQKLPKEALGLLVGLTDPSAAWKRLDERYGNREMSVIVALKRLKAFRPGKTASYDQIMEIAVAVQRCHTVLLALGKEKELIRDRETLSEVIGLMPSEAQQRWYHRKPPSDEDQDEKGEAFLAFLEDERSAAVSMHLDAIARKPVHAPTASSQHKPQQSSGGTDKGLYQPAHGTLQTQAVVSDSQVHAGGSEDTAKGSGASVGDRIAVKTLQDAQEVCRKRKTNLEAKKMDSCPLCKKQHTFEKVWSQVTPPAKTPMVSTQLASCPLFNVLSPDQKAIKIAAQMACPICTSWEHSKHKLPGGKAASEVKCKEVTNGVACGGNHGRWFHVPSATQSTTGNLVTDGEDQVNSCQLPGLYEVYKASFEGDNGQQEPGTMMIDSGSDTNYVCHDFARALGLVGEPHRCRLKVVDADYRLVETAKYSFKVTDKDGEDTEITALGLDTITTLPPDPDLSPLIPLLDGIPLEVLDRPQGRVDVLLGLRDSALHGRDEHQWGNLRLLRSRFGCGWAIRGTHDSLHFSGLHARPSYSAGLHALHNAEAGEPRPHQIFHVSATHATEFQELNELGTTPAPACSRCQGCPDCTFRRKRLSQEDQEVVARVEASMKVDDISGTISCVYPWKPCVSRMRDNRGQAKKIQESVERHMLANGTHGDFVEEVQKSIEEGKVRRIEDHELESWHGPVHYVTVFAVVKMSSVTTKTRVVSNSALQNPHSRLSLNQCMWPGPNALADLLDCLLFWRCVRVALMLDLRKAYQAIHTSSMDLHLRRFLFRSSPKDDWQDYGYTRANFGDVAAGLVLEIAKRRVAGMGRHIDPQAAQQLETKTYVDDAILGGDAEEVDRMRGERTGQQYSGTVAKILSLGAMTVKFMAVSGSDDLHEIEQLGGKCLGVDYDLAKDEIQMGLDPCFYARRPKSSSEVREVMSMGSRDVSRLQAGEFPFTRRQALSMVMGLYDPLGLIGPALVAGKLLLRRLYYPRKVLGWDQDLPREEKQRWASWFRTLLDSTKAKFTRSVQPERATGRPRAVGFSDSAALGMCVAVYVVWPISENENEARLLMAKCRVAPILGMTIPRGELQALTMLTRVLLVVAEACPQRFASISTYTDSMCSLGALDKVSSALKPFFGHRVSEIKQLREQLRDLTDDLPPVHHVAGELNPADLGTRGNVAVADLGEGSRWQSGPEFLRDPYPQWPVTTAEMRARLEVPTEELKKGVADDSRFAEAHVACSVAADVIRPRTDVVRMIYKAVEEDSRLGESLSSLVERCLSREKLELAMRCLARVLCAVLGGDRKLCRVAPSRSLLELAVQVTVRASSATAREALKQGKLQGLGAILPRRSGMGSRTSQGRTAGRAARDSTAPSHHELPPLGKGHPLQGPSK